MYMKAIVRACLAPVCLLWATSAVAQDEAGLIHFVDSTATPITIDGIPIHSLRLPGILSNQEVVFGGRGEVLRLVHETYGLDSFSSGILSSLRYAATAQGVGRGVGLAFEAVGLG